MDVKNFISQENSISNSDNYPLYKDYKALLALGYELISLYSGSLWTNYNDSDPGITILQNLCYALTELGSKTDLPIQDILAGENGRIEYRNHFHTPEQILPVNPVTCTDFSKALLDALPELKQVYITNSSQPAGGGTMKVSLEVKPEYVDTINNRSSLSKALQSRASTLLNQKANLAQIFISPLLLKPVLLNVNGTVSIRKSEIPEKVIAGIIYAGNNCLSPYPVYKSYVQLISEGKELPELLEGPFLAGGYIDDATITTKRDQLTTEELGGAFLSVEGVEQVNLKSILRNGEADETTTLRFASSETPYFSINEFLSTINILTNGKDVTSEINPDKVSFYLQQLIPVQQPCDLSELLPTGEQRSIEDYYSIQNGFPAIYQLTGKGPADPIHQAKVRQLKAYLVFMEQLMANYLSQLSKTSDLFSFKSGRTNSSLTTATYFVQPLYTVPGIESVLHGVEGYKNLHAETLNNTDWKAYMADADNPYARRIGSASTSVAKDLERKLKALEHLLARCGKAYDHQPLQFTNPYYGADPIAEIEYLKHTLQNFPLLSANRSRTYFKVNNDFPLISGLELNIENELGLRAFYQGMVEAVDQSFVNGEGLDIIYYDNGKAYIIYPAGEEVVEDEEDKVKSGIVVVQWNERLLFSFTPTQVPPLSMNAKEAKDYLDTYLLTLVTLAKPYYGCILIDCLRLASFLRFQWTLKTAGNTILYRSEELSFERLTEKSSLIFNKTALEIKPTNGGKDFEIGCFIDNQWIYLCDGVETLDEANLIVRQLQEIRSTSDTGSLAVEAVDDNAVLNFPIEMMFGGLVVCLPGWVALYQQPEYNELLEKKLLALAPASSLCYIHLLSLVEFEKLLADYGAWMEGLEELYVGNKANRKSKKAAFDILKSLLTWTSDEGAA